MELAFWFKHIFVFLKILLEILDMRIFFILHNWNGMFKILEKISINVWHLCISVTGTVYQNWNCVVYNVFVMDVVFFFLVMDDFCFVFKFHIVDADTCVFLQSHGDWIFTPLYWSLNVSECKAWWVGFFVDLFPWTMWSVCAMFKI